MKGIMYAGDAGHDGSSSYWTALTHPVSIARFGASPFETILHGAVAPQKLSGPPLPDGLSLTLLHTRIPLSTSPKSSAAASSARTDHVQRGWFIPSMASGWMTGVDAGTTSEQGRQGKRKCRQSSC